jgi:hypothetical protein
MTKSQEVAGAFSPLYLPANRCGAFLKNPKSFEKDFHD